MSDRVESTLILDELSGFERLTTVGEELPPCGECCEICGASGDAETLWVFHWTEVDYRLIQCRSCAQDENAGVDPELLDR